MKFAFKKYIYLINDVTNIILKKEREEEMIKVEEDVKKLRHALIIVSVLLFVSLVVNVVMFIR